MYSDGHGAFSPLEGEYKHNGVQLCDEDVRRRATSISNGIETLWSMLQAGLPRDVPPAVSRRSSTVYVGESRLARHNLRERGPHRPAARHPAPPASSAASSTRSCSRERPEQSYQRHHTATRRPSAVLRGLNSECVDLLGLGAALQHGQAAARPLRAKEGASFRISTPSGAEDRRDWLGRWRRRSLGSGRRSATTRVPAVRELVEARGDRTPFWSMGSYCAWMARSPSSSSTASLRPHERACYLHCDVVTSLFRKDSPGRRIRA